MILVPKSRIEQFVSRGWWEETLLGERFLRMVEERGDADAVIDPPNLEHISGQVPRSLSWTALLEEVGRYAAWLDAAGLRKDDVLVAQLPNGVDLHALYLACAITGVVISPVPVQYRAHELAHVFKVTGARVAAVSAQIGSHKLARHWLEHRRDLGSLDSLWVLGGPVPADAHDLGAALNKTGAWSAATLRAHMQSIGLTAHDVLTICWTSGTEAQAKGVPRNHNEWLVVGQSVIDAGRLQPGARMVIPFPFVNMAGLSTSLMTWLLLGATLHHHHPFDLDVFVGQLRDHPTDYTVAAPAVLTMMLKEPQLLEGVDLSRLKVVGSGGAPISEWLVEQLFERFGIELVNYFGSNEGASLSSSPFEMPDRKQRARYFPRIDAPGFTWRSVHAGKVRTRLVDTESQQDIVEPGRVGELRFTGPGIFSGYYRAPELTARAFDEEGFYRTGDLFEIAGAQGEFYRFVGRHKDIVIRGGMNVSAEEVEALLLGHPKVREAAVIGVPDPVLGERVCAVLALQPGAALSLAELVAHLRAVASVAAYKWPERLEVVDALPRNPVGKILKRELRARYGSQGGGTAGA